MGFMIALDRQYGLVRRTNSLLEGVRVAESMAAESGLRERWQERRKKLLEESEDIVEFLYQLCERAAARAL
jgi:hypothetical protein